MHTPLGNYGYAPMLECQPPYESMGSPLRLDGYAPMLGWIPPYESKGTPLCSNAYLPANLWLPPSEIKEISGGLELGRAKPPANQNKFIS
jgi:hypothetical protein